MFNSAIIRGDAADGYSSGQAMEVIERVAREHLPDNIGVEWADCPIRKKTSGWADRPRADARVHLRFRSLQPPYESWMVPIAVLLSLPVAAPVHYLGITLCGLENDIYFQTGLVMLVGLAAKNAILIVEFGQRRK